MKRRAAYFVTITAVFLFVFFTIYSSAGISQYAVIQEKKFMNKSEISKEKMSVDVFTTILEDMTLVTAYFDLGNIPSKRVNEEKYKLWASAYRLITNPLVVYTDSEDFYNFMTKTREDFPAKTKIIKKDKNTLWPFELIDKIKDIFSQPDYPKIPPNTVMAEYSAIQHAKYAMVSDAIRNKYSENKFYAWIDIGYFRDSIKQKRYCQLFAPPDLDKAKVAMNLIYKFNNLTPYTIFRENIVWVGGGMFIGTANVLLQFEQLYRRAVNYFLDKKLMNSDQQVLYSLYSYEGRQALTPAIELQLYVPEFWYPDDIWFYLGYHCRKLLPIEL